MDEFEKSPDNIELLETITTSLGILLDIIPELDLQSAQNVLFGLGKEKYPSMSQRSDLEDEFAKKWCEYFRNLANYLGVVVD